MILPHVGSKAQRLSTCNINRNWKLLVYKVLTYTPFRDVRRRQHAIEMKTSKQRLNFSLVEEVLPAIGNGDITANPIVQVELIWSSEVQAVIKSWKLDGFPGHQVSRMSRHYSVLCIKCLYILNRKKSEMNIISDRKKKAYTSKGSECNQETIRA